MANEEFTDFEIDADLSNVKPMEGGAFSLVDEGTYKVEIVHLKQDESSTNKQMVVVEYLILDGQDTPEAQAFAGQHLWQNYFLTDKAMGRLVQLMTAAGAPLDKFRASALMGAQILVDVVHNVGDARTDAEGNPLPQKTFANVCKERALDGGSAQAEETPPPPAAKANAAKAAAKPATTPPPATGKPAAAKNGTATRRA